MCDIVEKSVEEVPKKREAVGEVDGKMVTLSKKRYSTAFSSHWKVISSSMYQTKEHKKLSAKEADEKFEELVERHELEECEYL